MKRWIKVLIIGIVATVILFIFLFTSGTFSKFAAKVTGSSSTESATPVFVLNNGEKKILNDESTEVEYCFDICNFDSTGNRTETDLKYYIEITPENLDNSLSLELYNDKNESLELTNQKTDYIDIKHNKDITQSYRLVVKYDRTKTDAIADIQENIYIKAYAIQG